MTFTDWLISAAGDAPTPAVDATSQVALYGMIGVLGSAVIVAIVQVILARMKQKPPSTSTAQARRNKHYDAIILFLANNSAVLNVDARKIKTGYESLDEVRREP